MVIRTALVVSILARAVYTDYRSGKIENKLVLFALVIGTVYRFVAGGFWEVAKGVKAAVIMTGVLFVLFLLKGLGAGDIKLLSAISLFFPEQCIVIVIASFITAGIMCLLRIVLRAIRHEKIYIRGDTIHFSIPVSVGFVGVVLLEIVKMHI